MRTTFRLFAAACLLTATLGCQPEADRDAGRDFDIDVGDTPAVTTPDSNITGVAELPETTETPLTIDAPPAPEATTPPAVTETPTVTEVEPAEPVQTQPEADAEAAPQPVE
jgi:hypothetical protein